MSAEPSWTAPGTAAEEGLPEMALLRVVHGEADEEEIAALVTALAAVTAAAPPASAPGPVAGPADTVWARSLRPARPGPARSGWRNSGLPTGRAR